MTLAWLPYLLIAVVVLLLLNAAAVAWLYFRPAQTATVIQAPSLVDQAAGYFGAPTRSPMSADELSALVEYVNRSDKANETEPEMIDPNDEYRVGTGFANT